MNKWATVTIGELGKVFDGPHATPKTVSHGPIFLGIGALQNGRIDLGETRHVTPGDFRKWTRRVRPQLGDIVFSYETRLGQAAIIPDGMECCLGRRMGLVRVDPNKILPRFFLYNYISPDFQELIRSRTVQGATVDRILLKEFPGFPFPCPPLGEQQAIVSLLGALDDKIELNRRMNETLEAMARAIFKDWFVDFGPTRAKAEGRAPYLAPELWGLFPDALNDVGKPVGWALHPASELFEFNPPESIKKGTKTPYLDMAALPTLGAVADAPMHREYKSGSKFRDSDTLFARITPCLENGKTAYVFDLGSDVVGAGSTEFIVIRSRAPVPKSASYLLARDSEFRSHAERSMTGTSGRQRANYQALGQFELTAPSDERLWEALRDLVNLLMDKVISNAHESRTLAQARDLLLPKLMSGEIRLAEAEKASEAAT